MVNQRGLSFVGLGSNQSWLGQSPATLVLNAYKALSILGKNAKISALYRSPAWPNPMQPPYVNAVAQLETPLTAEELLASLLAIESGFGRIRSDDPALRYAPRSLDLDLLDHQGDVQDSATLTLPHPGLVSRDFVLLPLQRLAPDWQCPKSGEGIGDLCQRIKGQATRLPYV
ncbi:MAG: 2-amino-4-hydroxy-6-hydroxymethyldihydropteridine diphosphokinase [Pseudomonadota bacterium]